MNTISERWIEDVGKRLIELMMDPEFCPKEYMDRQHMYRAKELIEELRKII